MQLYVLAYHQIFNGLWLDIKSKWTLFHKQLCTHYKTFLGKVNNKNNDEANLIIENFL